MARGRPRLDPAARSVNLSVRLPPAVYDRVYQHARQTRQAMAAVVRRSLTIRLQK